RRRHTRCYRDWSSDVCSSDLSRFHKIAILSPPADANMSPLGERQIDSICAECPLSVPIGSPVTASHSRITGSLLHEASFLSPSKIGRASCRERVYSAYGALLV